MKIYFTQNNRIESLERFQKIELFSVTLKFKIVSNI